MLAASSAGLHCVYSRFTLVIVDRYTAFCVSGSGSSTSMAIPNSTPGFDESVPCMLLMSYGTPPTGGGQLVFGSSVMPVLLHVAAVATRHPSSSHVQHVTAVVIRVIVILLLCCRDGCWFAQVCGCQLV